MKKLKTLWLTFGMLIILYSLTGCCSLCNPVQPEPPVFPPKPERVLLVEDSNVNEYRLMVQDIRWMMWASFAEWKAGIIDQETYEADIERLQGVLDKYDEAFQSYLSGQILD